MNPRRSPFLTAEWRNLAMLNFEIDPRALARHVPAGTELDVWAGRHYVSIVGFLFLNTRVLGIPIPGHRNFEEVNLRFYVRHKAPDGWRRGVVFIKEIVPRFAITFVANTVYGENYVTLPMRHRIDPGQTGASPFVANYSWWIGNRENRIELVSHAEPLPLQAGGEEEFITEHYWGYAKGRGGRTTEYEVAHPSWRVRSASASRFDGDVAGLYGDAFVECLQAPPISAFLAEGSEVTVYRGATLDA